eukprot:jgi/Psemu1/100907/gw1.440.12.1
MKSWADHCSSDEDTDDNLSVGEEEALAYNGDDDDDEPIEEEFADKAVVDEGFGGDHQQQQLLQQPQARTYDFPDHPPFTAFVGNLSYDIQDTSQLQQAMADVVLERLGETVNVLGGRISYDRDRANKQHRGFGYIELETLDQLKLVMKLNDDGQALLAGRKIQVDTANHQNRSNHNHNHNNNNNRRGPNQHHRGSNHNNSNHNHNNRFRNNNSSTSSAGAGGAPRERPSLKLAPRSKPVEGGARSSSSNIFGGARARDEQAWEKSRQ